MVVVGYFVDASQRESENMTTGGGGSLRGGEVTVHAFLWSHRIIHGSSYDAIGCDGGGCHSSRSCPSWSRRAAMLSGPWLFVVHCSCSLQVDSIPKVDNISG